MQSTHKFLNVSEAAAYIGVSAASLRKWSDRGLVRVYRTPGGQRRYAEADLDEFLASMREPTASAAVPRYGRSTELGYSAGGRQAPTAGGREQPDSAPAERARRPAQEQRRRTRRAA